MPEKKGIRYGVPLEEMVSAKEKRKQIVRQVIKPLLKEAGFRTKGNRWKRELEDGWLLIHLINGSYGSDFECEFELRFGAYTMEEIGKNDPDKFWVGKKSLTQGEFLPYRAAFTPFSDHQRFYIQNVHDNKYGGFIDIPAENYMDQLQKDLETYVLPQLAQIKRVADWDTLWQKNWDRTHNDRKQIQELERIMYYTRANHRSPAEELREQQERAGLSGEDILSGLDWWLENMRKRQEKDPGVWIADDLRERILAALGPEDTPEVRG